MGGSIVMEPLGERKMANFGKLIGEAGDLNVMGKPYPRVQILSIPEILEGKRFTTPTVLGRVTSPQRGLEL